MNKTVHLIHRSLVEYARNPAAFFLLARMAAWVGWLSFAVKFMPLPKAFETLSPDVRSPKSPAVPTELATTLDRILRIDWLCFKPICWKRAAVLHRYLALNGIQTQVVFGMRKDENGQLNGHAWLEADGKPILEKEPPHYTTTYCFPSSASFDVQLELLND